MSRKCCVVIFLIYIFINNIIDGKQHVCARMVAILNIETSFVTFDLDLCFISSTSTSIKTESNEFSGINWRMTELQNCINEIAKVFPITDKIDK